MFVNPSYRIQEPVSTDRIMCPPSLHQNYRQDAVPPVTEAIEKELVVGLNEKGNADEILERFSA